MKISGNAQHLPRLDSGRTGSESPTLQEGRLQVTRPVQDLLEISAEGRQLAAGAIEHHEAIRVGSLPQKPNGAPDDYIPIEDLMKRFEPESYVQFQEAMANNAVDGLSLLLKFAKQVPKHPDWIETYWKEKLVQ